MGLLGAIKSLIISTIGEKAAKAADDWWDNRKNGDSKNDTNKK